MIKYIYYYIWLGKIKVLHRLQKSIFNLTIWFQIKVLKLKNIDDDELKRRKKDLNTNYYDFPDGISHWYAYTWTLLIFMILLYFIPVFTIEALGDFLGVNWIRHFIFLIPSIAISYYLIYIKKSNKEWLKKKIDKKKKDFSL